MPKHILFILDYYTPHRGWSETVFENIVSRLLKKWYEISILTSYFDSSLPRHEQHDHLTIYRTAKSRLGFVFSAFFCGWEILKRNRDIHVIHTSTYGGAIPASLLWIFFRKKVILTVHEIFGKLRYHYKWFFPGLLYRFFERLIFALPYDIYHCVSRYTMNSLRLVYGTSDAKIRMIYNGVDTDFRNKKNIKESDVVSRKTAHELTDRFVVLYYGHAGKSKWLDYLIEAMPEIIRKNSKILFVYNLIDSKRTDKIKDKIDVACRMFHVEWKKSIEIFSGFEQEQLRLLVSSADLVVAPSLSEGFGSVHTETVALEKPLLTTNVGPIPEVVRWNVKMIQAANVDQIISCVLDFSYGKITENIPEKQFSRDVTVSEIITLYK